VQPLFDLDLRQEMLRILKSVCCQNSDFHDHTLPLWCLVSQWEREAIGERARDALRHKRGNGERVGNIQFGYRLSADGYHVEPDSAEQAVVRAIRKLRSRGLTLRDIAATLNSHGHRTRRGSQWRAPMVERTGGLFELDLRVRYG
jgi:hypothetical protein